MKTAEWLSLHLGGAKSTIVSSFVYVVWNIVKEGYKFIVIVSATDALAEDAVDFIRLEFSDNKGIIEDFGLLIHGIGEKGDVTINKTRVFARGRKTAIHGFKNRQHRPDLIILDDIEKDEEAMSPSVVAKTLETIMKGLTPSLSPKGKFIFIGTILRTRSVAGTMLLSEDEPWNLWTRKIYKAIMSDGNGREHSLWEDRFSLEFLHKQKAITGISSFKCRIPKYAVR